MSKRSDPAAFARAAGAADPFPLAELAPAPDRAPPSESANALAVQDDDGAPPEVYDPADYRWVPVRRRPRLDGWTEEKQRRFIETLADTGLVNVAAKAVGMSRETAYRLRRSAHGAAFARAWDAARHHAGGLIEDLAFERAIEGTEQEVLNSEGEVVATRLVHDNGLLKWLLSHLKSERYGSARSPGAGSEGTADMPVLEESLRAMEPALPAPPEALLDPETFADELELADIADGVLPHFLSEQPWREVRRRARGGAGGGAGCAGGRRAEEERRTRRADRRGVRGPMLSSRSAEQRPPAQPSPARHRTSVTLV